MTETRFDRAVWYHDFTALGVPTKQRAEFYRKNQEAKAPIICRLIDEAVRMIIDELPKNLHPYPRHAVELFCADGFYACYLAQKWPFRVKAIDQDEAELERGHAVAKELGIQERIMFEQGNAMGYQEHADLVICTGGLYHLANPVRLLRQLCRPAVKAMVLQTVYNLEVGPEGGQFESPAEGRPHGSRFSALWILEAIEKAGWKILSSETNELSVNPPCDRGSLYVLCRPKEQHSKRTANRYGASSHD